jgi:hypothetical protein
MRTPSDISVTAWCDNGVLIYAMVLVLTLVAWAVIPA